MKPRLLFPLLALLLAAGCAPATVESEPGPAAVETASPATVAAEAITADEVFDHIEFLASDEMRGRDTPSPELERAAEYIAEHFRELGLEPAGDAGGYLQRWPFERLEYDAEASEATADVGGERLTWRYAEDFFAIPSPPVLVEGTPVFASEPAALQDLPDEAAGQPLVVGMPGGLGPEFTVAIQGAMQARAAGVVLLMGEDTDAAEVNQIAEALEAGAAGQMPMPIMGLSHAAGEELLVSAGIDVRGGRDPPEAGVMENVRLSFQFSFDEHVDEVPNVVAVLPGSDPAMADEYVILSAHYDHVGVGPPDETGDSIYSGADDNASGTSALLEVADAFAALPEAPGRSVVFLAVSGEEKGLLGSMHYADSPTVPAEGIVANLNMDMVARNHPDTVYGIGEEYTDLGDWAREIAVQHPDLGLTVAPDPEPEEQAFLRSDHFSFVQEGIPALMITTWLHDDYHVPSDTPDTVDPEKASRVARLVFLLAHRAASAAEPPEWNAAGEALLRELSQQGPPGG